MTEPIVVVAGGGDPAPPAAEGAAFAAGVAAATAENAAEEAAAATAVAEAAEVTAETALDIAVTSVGPGEFDALAARVDALEAAREQPAEVVVTEFPMSPEPAEPAEPKGGDHTSGEPKEPHSYGNPRWFNG